MEEDGFLGRGHDADVKRNLPPINPVSYKDVGRTRAGAWDETGHFLHRVEGCLLRLFIDFIPNSVMPATADAVVVLAMHRMIAINVFLFVAFVGAAGARIQKRKPQPVAHGRAKCPRVEVSVERQRRDSVTPIAGVRKSQGAKARLIAGGG